jgi:hypothetical protein
MNKLEPRRDSGLYEIRITRSSRKHETPGRAHAGAAGRYRHDPAGASLDRIDREKGYVPGNVRVVSLRANLLRKDSTYEELRALADFFSA